MTELDKLLDDLLEPVRVMLILRALDPDTTVARAEEAWAAGVRLIEVTIGTPAGVPSLAAAVAAGRSRGYPIAAGTVRTPDAARAAAAAGAALSVAPGFDPDVLAASRAVGLPHVPGVATPTEVHRATALDCRWLKAFPAVSLGPAWFGAIHGPFPDARFVATGGITPETAGSFLDAGAAAVGVGSAVVDAGSLAALARR